METQFTITFETHIQWDEDAKAFVAESPSLNMITQASTEERALEAIRDAVALHIRIAFQKGLLAETFQAWGVRPIPVSTNARLPATPSSYRVSVPVLTAV